MKLPPGINKDTKWATRSWPYGTTRKAKVLIACWRPAGCPPDAPGQLLEDEKGEAHICIGGCGDQTAKDGDEGILTFTKGGPTGGYWQFKKLVEGEWK